MLEIPATPTPLDVFVEETRTGQFMFGVTVNSNAGLIGNITLSERNFDILNPPTSWDDFAIGRAFRGRRLRSLGIVALTTASAWRAPERPVATSDARPRMAPIEVATWKYATRSAAGSPRAAWSRSASSSPACEARGLEAGWWPAQPPPTSAARRRPIVARRTNPA